MKLCVTAFSTLLLLAGISHADDLERPRGGQSGTIFHEWMSAPPPASNEDTGDVLQPATMEIQLLSGPSILPLGLLLLGLGAGRLVARGS